jgi:hypothetical protein
MDGRMVGFAAAVAVVLAGAEPAKDSTFVSLFDGKSLDGWVPEHTDRFTVRDGVIFNDGGTGWLRSAKTYKDFELQAKYRALKKGADTGLIFRASAESTPKDPHWPAKGYQLQVVDAADSNFKMFGHGIPPAKYDRKADALRSAMKGPGEWQTITLRVVGKHAEATLNGTSITVSEAINLPEGYIGLQGENGQFEWCEIKIRDLPAS